MTLQSQTVKLVNRRPAPERKALAFMRGGAPGVDMTPMSGQIDRPPYLLPFSQLRSYAMRLDLTIHPPANPYLSECERRILMWLAIAQRVSAHERDYHEDAAFTRMLFHCAGILTGLGICLPPVTMANGRTGMRDAAKVCA